MRTLEYGELSLLEAVEGMTFQYGWENDPLRRSSIGLFGSSYQILSLYGLYRQDEMWAWMPNDEVFSLLCDRIVSAEKKEEYLKYPRDLSTTYYEINERSHYLLKLLARLSKMSLAYPDGSMFHNNMGAGEHAFSELRSYGLIFLNEKHIAFWTERGRAMLTQELKLGVFPT